ERRCRHRSKAIDGDEYVLADLRLTEVIDLLNLRCREGAGKYSNIVKLAGIEHRRATLGEQINRVVPKVVRVGRGIQTACGILQGPVDVKRHLVPAGLSLVIYDC